LDEASALVFSHPGISAVGKTDAAGKPVPNQFVVSVDSATQPGLYDVRVQGLFGISNPRLFRIDTLPEIREVEPNNEPTAAMSVPVNTVVNARTNVAADVDVFRVSMQPQQTLVFRTEAAQLDSLIQPTLELFDASGRRVARSRRQLQRDAVIVFTSPIAQSVTLHVHDTVYAGGSDYGYRLSVDTRPQIDAISPGVLPPGGQSVVRVIGRNLPAGKPAGLTLDGTPLQTQAMPITLPTTNRAVGTTSVATSVDTTLYAGIAGNLVPLGVREQMLHLQQDADAPRLLELPAVVDGVLAETSEIDTFRMDAKKGERWQIDVLAERLGSLADPVLVVNHITTADDGTETSKRLAREELGRQNPGGNGLPTLTRDPAWLLTVAEDGLYELQLQDRYSASRGSAALKYTLVIAPPKPDFQAVVFDSLPSADGKAAPSSGAVSLRKGGTYDLPVYLYRSGGHNDAVTISADGLPEGVTMSAATIAAGQSSGRIVFQAAADAAETAAPIRLTASSGNGETAITREVLCTTLVHAGANGLPRTGRVSHALLCAVMKDAQPVHVATNTVEVSVSQDQQFVLPLSLTRAGHNNKVDVAFLGVPGNIDIPKVSFAPDLTSAAARFFVKDNAAPATVSLLMSSTAQVPYQRNPWQVERAKAEVAAAVAQLQASQQAVDKAKAQAAAAQAEIKRLTAEQQTAITELAAIRKKADQLQQQLKTQLQNSQTAFAKLTALKPSLPASPEVSGQSREDVASAVQQIATTTASIEQASEPVRALATMLQQLQQQRQQQIDETKTRQAKIDQHKQRMAAQQQLIATAQTQQQQAEAQVKATEAAKASTEKAVQAAEAAAKPQNKNVRTISVPVRLTIHPTPGKLTAAVPGGGAIGKGKSVDVPVTIARKNKFEGSVQVQLVLPAGESRITSSVLTIAADQTIGTLKLTAAADAQPGDLTMAVLRATGTFQEREASFDLPVALKVTE
ncbi:MAG: hypothetical protein NXI04_24270, partial [Planctomycetaceae bacterium]|nr:hypothetical protein [Planctomycetaceae bacterium]